jgi:hypothetical protein
MKRMMVAVAAMMLAACGGPDESTGTATTATATGLPPGCRALYTLSEDCFANQDPARSGPALCWWSQATMPRPPATVTWQGRTWSQPHCDAVMVLRGGDEECGRDPWWECDYR